MLREIIRAMGYRLDPKRSVAVPISLGVDIPQACRFRTEYMKIIYESRDFYAAG
jgi:hypothetical protein